MQRALIQGTRVAQLVPVGQEFSVAPPLHWVDAPDTMTDQHQYINGQFIAPQPHPAPIPSPLAQALDTLLLVPNPTPQQIVAVLRVWRQGVS